jgi:8-oxo-dGTP diphosphatase
MGTTKRIRVVAGIIFREDFILACQRHESGAFPLKWEFPGGKVQPGETDFDALRRELQEELGIAISEAQVFFQGQHRYPEGLEVSLIFFRIYSFEGVAQNLVFQRIEWVNLDRLEQMDFLDGDRPLIRYLVEQKRA